MENLIYGLRDPRNDVYCYIGKTTVGKTRPLSHLKKSHSSKVNEWVSDLRVNGFEPLVDVIEEVDDINKLAEREKYWVDFYFDYNPTLLNEQLKPRKGNIKTFHYSVDDMNKIKFFDESLPQLYHILRKARKVRKINQTDMAQITGISLGTLKRLESGEENVSLSNFIKYLKVVGCDVVNMLTTPNENTGLSR